MIEKMITPELIQLQVKAVDWRDALWKAGQPLVKAGDVTLHYVRAIIKSVEEYGPYFVIAPHIALAHASSKEGAEKLAMSVTTFSEPIKFGNLDNDPVSYIFTLSAPDSSSHLKAMQELVTLLSNESFYQILDQAEMPDFVLTYMTSALTTEKE